MPSRRYPLLLARVAIAVVALCLLAQGGGCASDSQDAYFRNTESSANVYVAPVSTPITKVAIMPFRAPTELIGASAADLFVTEVLRAGRYELVERSQMAKVLSEAELSLAGLSASRAAEVGAMLGADGVIIGTVDEYTTVAHRGSALPVVGITTRLIDCKTGKVMWSVDLAKRADSASITLPSLARDVVHEMMAGLYQKWKVQRTVAAPAAASVAVRPEQPLPLSREPPPPAPAAPAAFTLSDMGLREVVISWEDVPDDVTAVSVERAASPEGPFELVKTVDAGDGEYRDTGRGKLTDGTTYYYRLVAQDRDGRRSEPSAVKESMTAPPPDAPAAVRAVPHGSRAVQVEWEASPSEGIDRYVVERAPADAPEAWQPRGDVKGLLFHEGETAKSDLQDATPYLYRVTAVNRVGAVGTPSAPVKVVTEPPPAPVSGLVAEGGHVRCVPLTWAANEEPDVVAYEVWRADQPGGPFKKLADLKGRTTCRYLDGEKDPGRLDDDRTYAYRVIAVDAVAARSTDGTTVEATTRPPPPVVTGVGAESGRPREVPLRWIASPDEKAMGYVVARAAPGDDEFKELVELSGRETTSWTDQGGVRGARKLGQLEDGATYRYRVLAFNTARARAPWSDPVEATTKVVPAAPAGLRVSTGQPRRVTVSWDANPEADLASYRIEWAAGGSDRFREAGVVDGATRTFVHESQPDGADRCYRVRAVDLDTLESAWSEPGCGSTKPLPPPPAGVRGEWMGDGARVTWTGAAVADVQAYRLLKPGFLGETELRRVEDTEAVFSAAEVGKGLKIVLTTVDADGLESARTEVLELRPPAP